MCDEVGRQMGPWQLQRAFRAARSEVPGLPEGFRFHDLRHYYASLLISSALMSRWCRHGLGTLQPRRHWTLTGTSGVYRRGVQGPGTSAQTDSSSGAHGGC